MTVLGGELEEFDRFWASAAGGDVKAMMQLADLCDGEMHKDWLRRAADGGNSWAAHRLALELDKEQRLEEAAVWYLRGYQLGGGLESNNLEPLSKVLLSLGRLDEAQRWARQAVKHRPVPSNWCMLAKVLLRLGRPGEAERWARLAAEERPVFRETLLVLATVLVRRGKLPQALLVWRQAMFAPFGRREHAGVYEVEVVLVAVVSVAVVPFVKALMSKAGEDSYARARALVKWLFKRGQARKKGYRSESDQLLIVEDPDPKLNLAIWLGTDTPDKQLRALKDLDLDNVATDAQRRKERGVRIQWDEASQSWKALD